MAGPVRRRLGWRRPALWTPRSIGVGRGGWAARFAASRWSGRCLALLALLLALPLLPASPMAPPGQAPPVGESGQASLSALALEAPALPGQPARGPNADFFGIVGRDPWYEWNTAPARHPNDVNRAVLEGMAAELAAAGAGWVRVELRAEHDERNPGGPGYIDWRKWDWFIRECAPKYGLKVLLLLG